jgi:hypothetical protein
MTDGEKMVFAAALVSETLRLYEVRKAQKALGESVFGAASAIDTDPEPLLQAAIVSALTAVEAYRAQAVVLAGNNPGPAADTLAEIFDIPE